MLRLAARNARRDRRDSGAAVDPEAGQRQPPRAEMTPLQLLDKVGNQPFESLRRGFRMGRRLLQFQERARRPGSGDGGQRLRLAAERAVECIDRIVGLAETASERAPLDSGQGADGL